MHNPLTVGQNGRNGFEAALTHFQRLFQQVQRYQPPAVWSSELATLLQLPLEYPVPLLEMLLAKKQALCPNDFLLSLTHCTTRQIKIIQSRRMRFFSRVIRTFLSKRRVKKLPGISSISRQLMFSGSR